MFVVYKLYDFINKCKKARLNVCQQIGQNVSWGRQFRYTWADRPTHTIRHIVVNVLH